MHVTFGITQSLSLLSRDSILPPLPGVNPAVCVGGGGGINVLQGLVPISKVVKVSCIHCLFVHIHQLQSPARHGMECLPLCLVHLS